MKILWSRSPLLSTLLSSFVALLGALPSQVSSFFVRKTIGKAWSRTASEAACSHLLKVKWNLMYIICSMCFFSILFVNVTYFGSRAWLVCAEIWNIIFVFTVSYHEKCAIYGDEGVWEGIDYFNHFCFRLCLNLSSNPNTEALSQDVNLLSFSNKSITIF